ncbi:MAG: YihY/virulence factor BrkB family protein [Lachnospiraceae bacterium]|nr:YihY/virulence factor BrkB family protein [Lachnospiraceae bacterium]
MSILKIYQKMQSFTNELNEKHVSAYAAKTAYFIMLSFIPILMLLFTLLQFTPLHKADVLSLFVGVFPSSIDPLVISIVDEIYGKSGTLISISAIIVLWTAGKGITAIIQGLNSVFDVKETRNYLVLRIYGAFYTVLMILAILLLLVLVVFGNKIQTNFLSNIPLIGSITGAILKKRYVISICLLVLIFAVIYHFMPNTRIRFKYQLPGAVFTAASWSAFSFGFSVYVDYFSNMSNMYGSLTTIIIVMLWLYMCMYIMLIGAVINGILMKKSEI